MKKIFSCAALVAFGVLTAFTIKNDPLPIGSALPKADKKLQDVSGREITLQSSIKSNGLLVMFSCNTCPVVMSNQDRTKAICKFAQDNKVGVVLLNSNEGNRDGSESLEAMTRYGQSQSYGWTYAVDQNSELADAFGASRTPEVYLFDKSGKLVYTGAIDDNPQDAGSVRREHLKEALKELTTGKPVSIKTSRSVGCNIKRS